MLCCMRALYFIGDHFIFFMQNHQDYFQGFLYKNTLFLIEPGIILISLIARNNSSVEFPHPKYDIQVVLIYALYISI